MPFRRILTELVDSVPGATSAVFLDYEGEAVDEFSHNGDAYSVRFLGAHNGIILNAVKRVAELTNSGEPLHIHIHTEKYDFHTTPIHDGYFVVLAVKSGHSPGMARFMLERTASLIRDEMGY